MKKKLVLASILAGVLTVATACSNSSETTSSEDTKEKTEATETKVKEEKSTESKSQDKTSSSEEEKNNKESETAVINPEIKKTLDSAKLEVIYENKTPNINVDLDGFKFDLERYQVVHVTNANPADFGEQEKGYIITVKANVDNQSKGNAYFNLPDLQGQDQFDRHLTKRSFTHENMLRPKMKSTVDEPAHYKKSEAETGLFEYILTKEEYEKLQNANTKLLIPNAASNKEQTEHLGESQTVDFPLSESNAKAQETSSSEFYKDNIVNNNVADKELLKANEEINQTQKSSKVDVTLDGIQFVKLNPTESYKNEFTSFDGEDVVAATVKLTIKNNTNAEIPLRQFSTFLATDKVQFLDQGTLSADSGEIKPGQTGDKYLVYLMKGKSDYEATNNFKFRITHITDGNGDDLLDKEMSFDISK